MSSYVEQSTFQYEDLASHGYIVVSVSHPYDSSIVLFPDGRHIALDTVRLKAWNDEVLPFLNKAMKENGGLDAYLQKRPEEAEAEFRHIIKQPLKQESMSTWVADLHFVVDELHRLAHGALAGWLDLERIGAFGHSFGGAACAHAAWQDARIKAVLNIDGTQYSELAFAALEQPLMFIFGTQYGKAAGVRMWELAKHRIYRITIKGAYHLDFTDFARFSPLFRLFGLFGPLGADRVHALTRRYTLAFFDRHLKGKPEPMLDSLAEPGVEFEYKN